MHAFLFCSEEGEKFNVWVAWLNLETAYGTQPSPEEAAMGLLRRALQYTDQKKMYLAALGTTQYDTHKGTCRTLYKHVQPQSVTYHMHAMLKKCLC